MTPLLQKPLDLGVDVVVHSATKFLAGHSDILAGAAVTNNRDLADQIYFVQNAVGATLGVLDSWLLLRGMKTLGVRMTQASASALKIATWLEKQPVVQAIHYPGIPSDKGYGLHKVQAKSGGAVLSFELSSEAAVAKVVQALTIPIFSVSLGGVESIISYPPKMSHAELSTEELAEAGIQPGLLRLSVGLEDGDDLIADLDQAFATLN
jgi:cystathionine beta-lyase